MLPPPFQKLSPFLSPVGNSFRARFRLDYFSGGFPIRRDRLVMLLGVVLNIPSSSNSAYFHRNRMPWMDTAGRRSDTRSSQSKEEQELTSGTHLKRQVWTHRRSCLSSWRLLRHWAQLPLPG
jgi:hypothetical protein